jgi:hypothetical protein
MQLNIFFSHAWADKESATLKFLQNRLNEQHNVWFSTREIAIGDDIPPEILEGIRKCDVYLTGWSKSAEASKAVRTEFQAALELKKRIIVCAIDRHPEVLPFNGDFEQVVFTGDPSGDETEWTKLSNLLLSAALEESAGRNGKHEAQDPPGIDAELENLVENYRKNLGADRGNPYIEGALDEFVKLFGSEEDLKMRRFAEAARAISLAYPFGKDDRRKQLLLLRAIVNIDPEDSEPELRELREFLERQHALDLEELREEREKARMAETAGTADSPVARGAFQRLAGRKLLAMQSSASGTGETYANSSDVIHLQLLADGSCRFRLVRSNYASHFGMIRDEKEEEGTWSVVEDKGRLFLCFDWKNNSPERLELILDATGEVLLNKVRYGIVELNHEV